MSVNRKRREWRQIKRYVTNEIAVLGKAKVQKRAFQNSNVPGGAAATDQPHGHDSDPFDLLDDSVRHSIPTTSIQHSILTTSIQPSLAKIPTVVSSVFEPPNVHYHGSEQFVEHRPNHCRRDVGIDDGNVTNERVSFHREHDKFDSPCYQTEDKTTKLTTFLRTWALDNDVSLSCLSSLLKGLSECCSCCSSLPVDGRSLLKTERNIGLRIKKKAGGSYVHIGIAKGIQEHIEGTTDKSFKLIAIVNIDGLPVFKSSGLQFWPILMRITNGSYDKPFAVGIYSGTTKPKSIHDFLADFVSEMVSVIATGVTIGLKHFDVVLKCVMTDAPALAMIKCIKGHCGYFGCPRCIQEGSRVANCTVFLETDALLRTDDAFRRNAYDDDHQSGISPLLPLPIDMINDIPFDYMHLVCLGVVKQLLNAWISGPLPSRIPSRLVEDISSRLVTLRGHLPIEFARQPRSLTELGRWKATELRQFLLYSGILVLDGILQKINSKLYLNFLLLHSAIHVLCQPSKLNQETIQFAHECLINFVKTASVLYGEQMIVYNVHGLTHLAADVTRMGCLDSYSCFPFENYMSTLKRYVRSPNNPLAQVVSRLGERSLTEKKQYCKKAKKGLLLKNGLVKTCSPDNCVRLVDGKICIITELLRIDDNAMAKCRSFRECISFFDYPCNSLNLGIALVSKLEEETTLINTSSVVEKLVLLPKIDEQVYLTLPLLHSDK